MKELKIAADTGRMQEVFDFINGELEGTACSDELKMQIQLVVEEIFVNIASYAYEDGNGTATVQCELNDAKDSVTLTFIDSGVRYDPLSHEDPDITLSAMERRIGGLGIFLVKKLMDEVSYEYKDEKNVLTMVKRFA